MSLGDVLSSGRAPLAERLRPRQLSEVLGQPELSGPQSLLRRALEAGKPYSLVLYGPPGTGKTTVALAVAGQAGYAFEQLNAVVDGIKDFREVLERARERRDRGENTLLFIDEIHRFNKAQQDALLPAVESGLITLMGATTENPAHSLTRALRSRLRIERVRPLGEEHLRELARLALSDQDRGLGASEFTLSPAGLELLILYAGGDGRALLSGLDAAALLAELGGEIGEEEVKQALGSRLSAADRAEQYHLLSALIKSIRGSDPDATLYWLGRLEASGEDPVAVARRLVISASEEIGLARPGALAVANSGAMAVSLVGAPECWLNLAHVACYLAQCPKSWATYRGLAAVREYLQEHPEHPVPLHLRNPSDEVSRAEGAGRGYAHPSQAGAGKMRFLPPELEGKRFLRESNE